jgi:hypothetical protein
MKNWFAPLALLGLSGLGLLVASERGRRQLRAFVERMGRNGDPLGEFNDFLDGQLQAIQDTLDHLAEAMNDEQKA